MQQCSNAAMKQWSNGCTFAHWANLKEGRPAIKLRDHYLFLAARQPASRPDATGKRPNCSS